MMSMQAPPPGAIVREHMNCSRLTQGALAKALGISAARLSLVLNGQRPVTPDVALRLGKVTSTDPRYWLGLQSSFYLDKKSEEMADALERLPVLAPEQRLAA
jgi:addiction module HigA family antidote